MLKDKLFLFLILAIIIASFIIIDLPRTIFVVRGDFLKNISKIDEVKIVEKEPVYSKGIYITFRTAGTKRVDEILELIKRTELNTIVIDIKDYTGRIPFDTDSEFINSIGAEQIYIKDIRGLVDKFKNEGIYTIARIVVFEDNYLPEIMPELALKNINGSLWRDNRGLSWFDPSSKEVWDYVVDLSRQAVKVGFDEINLDYIRFPTDGNLSAIRYPFWDGITPKKEVIRQFFQYFSSRIKPMNVFISADLFGLTLTSQNDLNIGQWLEYAGEFFDYICPMTYPSHYYPGHKGFENPAAYPYETIYDELVVGNQRLASSSAKIRPWLQDFDLGANYDANMINLQKQAVYDSNSYGWLFWNPRNVYTEDGFHKEE
ncbi:putative glycoside hydrolase [Patescibacteria group bacterium]|nr:putative glycoside hydrolase [Patescibacteria group bacterium]